MPKDRITQLHQGYGFIEFLGEEDADYAIKVMNMIKVYGKPIRVNKVHVHVTSSHCVHTCISYYPSARATLGEYRPDVLTVRTERTRKKKNEGRYSPSTVPSKLG